MAATHIYKNKTRGWIFLNGNVQREGDLVRMFKTRILEPETFVPELNRSRKVLLVTAAFQKGHEHQEEHIIEEFVKIGVNPVWRGAFPTNIQNLSIYTMFEEFIQKEKWLYRRYTEKQDQIQAVKRDYFLKNRKYVDQIHFILRQLKKTFPSLGLNDFFKARKFPENPNLLLAGQEPKAAHAKKIQLEKLLEGKETMTQVDELRDTIIHLQYKDSEIIASTLAMENLFLENSGISRNALYNSQREELRRRILSSATIFIFGGRVYVLVNRLRFYRVREMMEEALKNGSNIYGISAGSLCQMDHFSMNFEKYFDSGYIRAEDSAMGLVNGLSIFPHANDYQYIRNAERDTLSFFAIRHPNRVVVGLNENSVLLYEHYREPRDKREYIRISSQGEEPALIFGERGVKVEMQRDSQILVPGTQFFSGSNQHLTPEDVAQLEAQAERGGAIAGFRPETRAGKS